MITKPTIMSFDCFIREAEFGVFDLFSPSRYPALRDVSRLCANERLLIPLSRGMKANILNRRLLTIINEREADSVSA